MQGQVLSQSCNPGVFSWSSCVGCFMRYVSVQSFTNSNVTSSDLINRSLFSCTCFYSFYYFSGISYPPPDLHRFGKRVKSFAKRIKGNWLNIFSTRWSGTCSLYFHLPGKNVRRSPFFFFKADIQLRSMRKPKSEMRFNAFFKTEIELFHHARSLWR